MKDNALSMFGIPAMVQGCSLTYFRKYNSILRGSFNDAPDIRRALRSGRYIECPGWFTHFFEILLKTSG